jgi:linoleoyl-CoA desaturase
MGGTIYILAGNAQLAGTTQCITPHLHEYSRHDEDLDGRIILFTKEAKWHSFHRFQQYYSVFYMAY